MFTRYWSADTLFWQVLMVMVMNLYSALSIYIFKAAIRPFAISPSTLISEIRPNHNTGNYMSYSLRQFCGPSFTYRIVWTVKGHRRVYSLESLTICGKGSTFSSVGSAGVELTTSRMAVRCSTDWATGARCSELTITWMSNIKDYAVNPRLHVSVNLLAGIWLTCCVASWSLPSSSCVRAHKQYR